MLTALVAALGPFIINFAMQAAKWLSGMNSTAGKRFVLALFSIAGVIAYSAYNGTPVDPNSITSLVQVALLSLGAFLASHGSYTLFSGSPTDLPNA